MCESEREKQQNGNEKSTLFYLRYESLGAIPLRSYCSTCLNEKEKHGRGESEERMKPTSEMDCFKDKSLRKQRKYEP